MNKWLDKYPTVDESHAHDLEREAAINEFERGMPRTEAEAAAHGAYSQKHHIDGAAHHYAGLQAATATGNHAARLEHGYKLAFHRAALGHDHMSEVPDDIKARSKQVAADAYGKEHASDIFLANKESPEYTLKLNISEYLPKFERLLKTAQTVLSKLGK